MSVAALAPIGIIGGTGWLGRSLGRAFLASGALGHDELIVSNRSGVRTGYEEHPEIVVTTDLERLLGKARSLMLAVPPADFGAMDFAAGERLVISIMAGASIGRIAEVCGARAIVRTMPNVAAEFGLCYTPWFANDAVDGAQRAAVQSLFECCGQADEVASEDQIDYFTALTGPVPGFVAQLADCMVAHAVAHAIPRRTAERAVKQLFHASGVAMARSTLSPAELVSQMLDYDGTTAAGLRQVLGTTLRDPIGAGLEAAWAKARTDMTRG